MTGRIRTGMIVFFTAFAIQALASDSIIVKKDARLDILTVKQTLANRKASMLTANGLYKGFRLQVISTSKRDDAFRIKSELLSKFPEHKSYALYQSPNFKVRIGNFIKREDAEKFKIVLNRLYPQGVYIVEDGIEYTPPPDEELIP